MKKLILFFVVTLSSQGAWLPGWTYRAQLTLSNSQGSSLSYYPTQILLTAGNFTFSQILADCSDIRVTGTDGVTIIPYSILSCNKAGQTAELWIKPTSLPAGGSYLPFLYWGNATPALFDVPPAGPWVAYAGNPVITGAINYAPENVIYDPVSAKYWMMIEGTFATNPDLPANPGNWTLVPVASGQSGAGPHLLLDGGTFYMYAGGGTAITVSTSATVNGTYTATGGNQVVSGTAWKSTRVLEPYVFKDTNTGLYVMFYMGDTDNGTGEQVGYATASSPTGPWTDYASNPVLAFGAAGTYDAGLIADPYVYQMGGLYYIFYACSPTTSAWQTCYATSPDLVTFTKVGLINWSNVAGWDTQIAWRGAVSRFADTYYITYGGQAAAGLYQVGIATQSAKSTATGYPPYQIFQLYDNFANDGGVFDTRQWRSQDANGSGFISGGVLTITSGVSLAHVYQSRFAFPSAGTVFEYSAQRTALSTNNAGELGSITSGSNNRIFDNSTAAGFWFTGTSAGTAATTINPDLAFHTQSVWLKSSTEADFKVDAGASWIAKTANNTGVSQAWLESYGAGGQNTSFNLNWARVRPYSEPVPTSAVGAAQTNNSGNSLMFSIP